MTTRSKTQIALELVRKGEMTPYAAAKEAGIATSTLYNAIKRQEGKETCPCCGQIVREGFSINQSVMKKS